MPPPVSVICATYDREEHLRNLVRYFCAQTYEDIQLIILDDSPAPSNWLDTDDYREEGVNYYHMPNNKLTLGTKLNVLMQMAEGEILVQFDDDDYYAPNYVEHMVRLLGDHDFATLSRWFGYSFREKAFCYWETDRIAPRHYMLAPGEELKQLDTTGWGQAFIDNNLWGYGFSYVWRRHVYPKVEIADITWGSDLDFYKKLIAAGFRAVCGPDAEGLVLHLIHANNSSKMFPQYILPDFLVRKFFPIYAEERGL